MKKITLLLVILLIVSGCVRDTFRRDAGALIGGGSGFAIAKGLGGGPQARVLGLVLGGLVGGTIGNYMDVQDKQRTIQAIDQTPTGKTSTWKNPDTQSTYDITPTRTFINKHTDGYCREVTIGHAKIGQKRQAVYGTACRQPDGSWKMVQ